MAQQMPMLNVGGSNLPPEIMQQQQALNRQQQMAQLLMQQGQSMPQGQMVSGRFVAPSFAQYLAPLAQTYVGQSLAKEGDKASVDLAKALRQQYADEMQNYLKIQRGQEATPEKYTEMAGPFGEGVGQNNANIPMPVNYMPARAAIKADPQAANLFGSTAYNPVLQKFATEEMFKKPKWEKAELPNPDGSIRKGWVDYNSTNPLSTFVEGGTKPAFTSLEGAKFQYDTGIKLPTGGMPTGSFTNAPMNMSASGTATQVGGGNMPVSSVGQMPIVGGRGMSPAAQSDANKQIFVDATKRQIEYAEKAPAAINFMQDTINNVNALIGDTKVVKDPKTGKESIQYGKIAPHAGFNTAVGVSGITGGFGAAGFLPATDTTDFKERFKQIGGQTFLAAFQNLRGAGQITEQEGTKATAALNRMSLAQSELEFVKAAREFEENVTKGMELARKQAGMPSGQQGSRQISPQDQDALNWANANPNDPRSAQIKQRLGK